MAAISLQVGTITSTKSVANALALEILGDFIKANSGVPNSLSTSETVDISKLSQQEQLDWILDQLLKMIVQSANQYKKRAIIDTAVVTSGIDARGWK